MSRLFEALSGLKSEHRATRTEPLVAEVLPAIFPQPPRPEAKPEQHFLKVVQATPAPHAPVPAEPPQKVEAANKAVPQPTEPNADSTLLLDPLPESRLVAWTNPNSLGAEKFRALAMRFDHSREQRELKSFQVTSSVIDEGKTLVAANISVTLAKYSGCKTLLVEGDLHRPSLTRLFGHLELPGLNDWWSGSDSALSRYVYRMQDTPLWFLPAGKPTEQPADVLRSRRFKEAFQLLAEQFEWTVVDSTPMLPIVDVNLWSKLLDGTLLVVREGVAPIKDLKRGLQALDHPKLIGVVFNEATELNQAGYSGQYYAGTGSNGKPVKKK
jgi:capsular exopolysaccharide synthesis family protein